MDRYRTQLERARTRFAEPDLSMDDVMHRLTRKRRNERIAAGMVGSAIALLIGFAAFTVARSSPSSERPATPVTIEPHQLAPTLIGTDGSTLGTISGLPADAWQATMSPDGAWIAYVTRSLTVGDCGPAPCNTEARIVVVRTDGSDSHYVAPVPSSYLHSVSSPAWSPDGDQLAYVDGSKGTQDIYVVEVDGTNLRRLTSSPAMDEFPTWSPDGSTIVYDSSPSRTDSSDLSPGQEIWSVPATGGEPTRLTHNRVPDQAPSYSPDGQQLVFSHAVNIVVMDAVGGPLTTLSTGWSPRWSPDGASIAFLTFSGERGNAHDPVTPSCSPSCPLGRVVVIPVAGGPRTVLDAFVPSSANAPSWLPAGDALLIERFTGPVQQG
jgi:Tol biopolymer transport system component